MELQGYSRAKEEFYGIHRHSARLAAPNHGIQRTEKRRFPSTVAVDGIPARIRVLGNQDHDTAVDMQVERVQHTLGDVGGSMMTKACV